MRLGLVFLILGLLGVVSCAGTSAPPIVIETPVALNELAQGPDEAATDEPAPIETARPTESPPSPPSSATSTTVPLATETQTTIPSATATNPASPTTEPSATATEIPPTKTAVPPTETAVPPTATLAPTAAPTLAPTADSAFEDAVVVNVVDGDTIEISRAGTTYRVRYIGVTAPAPDDPFGAEATSANAALVQGKRVRLEVDVSDTDSFERLLRYVYVDDVMVNGQLVRQGLARVTIYPPDEKYKNALLSFESEARNAGRGLWAQASAPPTTAPSNGGNCDPSYSDVCIPPSPPDLDCGEIPFRRFKVLPPDPHRFDGNQDGVGCEGG